MASRQASKTKGLGDAKRHLGAAANCGASQAKGIVSKLLQRSRLRIGFNEHRQVLLGRAYQDKSEQESLIEASDLDWLIVRPGVLTSGPKSGAYRVLTNLGFWRNDIVSRADVADLVAERIAAELFGLEKPVIIRCPL